MEINAIQNAILNTILNPSGSDFEAVRALVKELEPKYFNGQEVQNLLKALKVELPKLDIWDGILIGSKLKQEDIVQIIELEQNPLQVELARQYYRQLQKHSLEFQIRQLYHKAAEGDEEAEQRLDTVKSELETVIQPVKSARDRYKKYTLSKYKTENIQATTYISSSNTIPLNTISMIFSDSGVGKTRNAIAEANTALSQGGIDSVIVLDFDMGIKSLKKRGYDDLVEKWGEDKFYYLIGQELADQGVEPKQVLADFANDQEDYSQTLFILDNGSSFIFKDDSEQVDGLFRQLKKLRARGATTILIHHSRKSNDERGEAVFYGSYAWKKHIDYQYLLQKSHIGEDIFLWKVAKNRDGEIENRAFKIENDKLHPVDFDSVNLSKVEIDFIQATKEILKDGSYKQADLIKEVKQSVAVGDNRALKYTAPICQDNFLTLHL